MIYSQDSFWCRIFTQGLILVQGNYSGFNLVQDNYSGFNLVHDNYLNNLHLIRDYRKARDLLRVQLGTVKLTTSIIGKDYFVNSEKNYF